MSDTERLDKLERLMTASVWKWIVLDSEPGLGCVCPTACHQGNEEGTPYPSLREAIDCYEEGADQLFGVPRVADMYQCACGRQFLRLSSFGEHWFYCEEAQALAAQLEWPEEGAAP